jgi:double-GTPase-like protein
MLPWLGSALGQLDLEIVSARAAPHLVGIIGLPDAGKTTLLSVLYLLLWRGARPGGSRFSGSFTLSAWEGLAENLRWQPNRPPQFPPHTSRSSARIPGLLHMAFRREAGRLTDAVFTDAPGEWFEEWSNDCNSALAAGARWTVERSTSLALLLDCEALSGVNKGVARGRTLSLIRRLADQPLEGRPLAIVWSKSDQVVPDGIRGAIDEALREALPGHKSFRVSTYGENGTDADESVFLDVFDWLLTSPGRAQVAVMPESSDTADAFLSYRGPDG